jgi:hypothetical protein
LPQGFLCTCSTLWFGRSDSERQLKRESLFLGAQMGDLIFAFAAMAFFAITAGFIVALDRI